MRYADVLAVLNETELSPEELAPVVGVSNMTLRRWRGRKKNEAVNSGLEPVIREGVYKLLIKGALSGSSENVQSLLKDSNSFSFDASIKSLGIEDSLSTMAKNEDATTLVLAKIGHSEAHRDEVDKSQAEISRFKKFGESWRQYITGLMRVVRSTEISALDKVVAYGALFYLIYPFDLIPDSIPVVGYLDDYAMLAIAAAFYAKRYSHLFKPLASSQAHKAPK